MRGTIAKWYESVDMCFVKVAWTRRCLEVQRSFMRLLIPCDQHSSCEEFNEDPGRTQGLKGSNWPV